MAEVCVVCLRRMLAGVINDMDATIAAIVAAADLPLSIMIVGVGEADFSMMDTLDGDDERLSYNGKRASRDIVQFVPMHEHASGAGTSQRINTRSLCKALLEELPGQMLEWFEHQRILPNPGGHAHAPMMTPVGFSLHFVTLFHSPRPFHSPFHAFHCMYRRLPGQFSAM